MVEAGELREVAVAGLVTPGDGDEERPGAGIALAQCPRVIVVPEQPSEAEREAYEALRRAAGGGEP